MTAVALCAGTSGSGSALDCWGSSRGNPRFQIRQCAFKLYAIGSRDALQLEGERAWWDVFKKVWWSRPVDVFMFILMVFPGRCEGQSFEGMEADDVNG